MLAALLYGQEDLRLEQVADPTPAVGEIVIQVGAATTCGTDLKVWRRGGHAKMLKPPTLFGHEAAGTIVAVGAGVGNWRVGDRVVANNSAPCMECFFCQRQEYSLCPNLTWNNGTFAEYLKIPAPIVQHNLLHLPDELPFALAAMTEPLACVLHGVARSHIKPKDKVVILGDGAIGLMFVAALADKVEVLLWGGSDQRLEIGQKLGAAQTFNYHQISDIPGVVKELTQGWGADVVIEATGVPSVWETAIACARPGATVNLFGGCPRDTTITVNTEQLHYSELTLKGVFHNTPKYVRSALAMIASQKLPLELLISESRPLKDLEQVFYDMKARQVIKVAMVCNQN
ncbi:alcohol dehydrogenase catalytic domain-containing protein [Nostoc sp. FACHB-87]|uniref:zinc-dependent alcohol dehydrogenase n=1 Tax=Nostocaceae TaxID=1162 RepID=UPI001682C3CB|nr:MULTISPECIES: alcohol dehydrogenase catalytic domain-containing protein [Nostocaceae]MBD2453346.1 alcohol dehydrogenase catalytic domain-containing protein [Nostoc sp. FACHB-87]MBD2475470.1 alcohol dehydrogenase catalytic domain-containing protein [Anabaena sp. FACHB-83]